MASPATQEPMPETTMSPSHKPHTSYGCRSQSSKPHSSLSLLFVPDLLWLTPPIAFFQSLMAYHCPFQPMFLVASKALSMSCSVLYWVESGFPDPDSHCPLSCPSRSISGISHTLTFCFSYRTSHSFLNTSHSPKPPCFAPAIPCPRN